MEAPRVSVITIVRNDREGLRATLDSVRAQDHPNVEQIAIDGGSGDGSAELLRERAGEIAHWVSEPDAGISDAFNKGLAAATGEWINFLNAGDTFTSPGSVARAAAHFQRAPIVTAFSAFGSARLPPAMWRNRDPLPRRALLSHQSSFVNRRVFGACGGFDSSYRVRMDYEFWLRALRRFEFVFVDEVWTRFALGGASGRDPGRHFAEELRANRQHLDRPTIANAWAHARRARSRLARATGLRRLSRALRG